MQFVDRTTVLLYTNPLTHGILYFNIIYFTFIRHIVSNFKCICLPKQPINKYNFYTDTFWCG